MSRASFPVVVHVVLRRLQPEPQIFFLRRTNTGFLDGYYALPGGHVENGELPMAAAIRECVEETDAMPHDLVPLATLPYRYRKVQGINLVFETQQFNPEPRIAEPEFADRAIWAGESDLPEPRPAWVSDVLRLHGQGQWYSEFDAS